MASISKNTNTLRGLPSNSTMKGVSKRPTQTKYSPFHFLKTKEHHSEPKEIGPRLLMADTEATTPLSKLAPTKTMMKCSQSKKMAPQFLADPGRNNSFFSSLIAPQSILDSLNFL